MIPLPHDCLTSSKYRLEGYQYTLLRTVCLQFVASSYQWQYLSQILIVAVVYHFWAWVPFVDSRNIEREGWHIITEVRAMSTPKTSEIYDQMPILLYEIYIEVVCCSREEL